MSGQGRIAAGDVERFLDHLDAYSASFLTVPPDAKPARVFFIDLDVIHTYIAGIPARLGDRPLWTNPLSVSDRPTRHFADFTDDTIQLTDAIGRAVTSFLFGELTKQMTVQLHRYYLTPEHDRELQSIFLNVLHQAADPPPDVLQQQLRACFLQLCETSLDDDVAQYAIEQISALLGEQSAAGAVARGNAIRRHYTTALATQLIRPPSNSGRAFIFHGEKIADGRRFNDTRDAVFEAHLQWLMEGSSSTARYFELKRAVFESYVRRGASRKVVDLMRDIGERPVARTLGSADQVRRHIMKALRETADVMSLARLSAIAHELATQHPLHGRRWEICLITGSLRLAGIVTILERSPAAAEFVRDVRIIHPLCFLRHPELYDPDGVAAVSTGEPWESFREEYALGKILGGRADGAQSIDTIDADRFVVSLTRTLQGVLARVASDDRTLRRILVSDERYDPDALRHAVRSFVAHSFAETFISVMELGSVNRPLLPGGSVPVLAMHRSPTAQLLFSHTWRTNGRRPSDHHADHSTSRKKDADVGFLLTRETFEQILREDATGYSALLCAAVGYVARGRSWLPAARAVVSTAIMFSEGRLDRSQYPHGSEALFLRSWIARLSFDPRPESNEPEAPSLTDRVSAWHEQQRATMGQAIQRLDDWKLSEPAEATDDIFELAAPDHGSYSSYDLARLRFDAERLANQLFERLWIALYEDPRAQASEEIHVASSEILGGVLAESSQRIRIWSRLGGTPSVDPSSSSPGPRVARVREEYAHQVAFVGRELWSVALQCWVLLDHCVARLEPTPAARLQSSMKSHETALASDLARYKVTSWDDPGVLLRTVSDIFAMRTMGSKRGSWGPQERDFAAVKFAAIDELRFPFYLGRWRAAATHPDGSARRITLAPFPHPVRPDAAGDDEPYAGFDEPIRPSGRGQAGVGPPGRPGDLRNRFDRAIDRLSAYVKEQRIEPPKCFISYARRDRRYERWVVRSLATDLMKAGLHVVLDQWENTRIGASVTRFVERIAATDRVIVVGTPEYRQKYDDGRGYLAAEGNLIARRMMMGTEDERDTILPVLRAGTEESSFPPFLQGTAYADLRNDEAYFATVFDVILSLYRIPTTEAAVANLRESLLGPDLRI